MPTSTIDPVFVSIGDIIYDVAGVPNPRPIGVVTALDFTNKEIVVNPTGYALLPPFPNDVLFSLKNSIAESNGLLGHYLQFTITNDTQDAVELFAVGTDSMVSNPIQQQTK